MNYLEMINVATNSLRGVLKESKRAEVMGRATFSYRMFEYEQGHEKKPGA